MSSHLPGIMSTDRRARAWIEVQASALRRNLRSLSARVGANTRVIPMVKADAYGLGAEQATAALESEGPFGYGVATLDEGRALRTAGVRRPVFLVAPIADGSLADAVELDLTPTLSALSQLEPLERAARRLGTSASFQIEVDTGMGRSGFDWRAVSDWGPRLERLPATLLWTGCFTHYHSADLADRSSIDRQWQRLRDAVDHLKPPSEGFLIHGANSAAALAAPDLAGDAIRPGIYLYGGEAGAGLPGPEPVATLRARILLVRDVPPGTSVGYGATYRSEGWERWATVGLGYGDGLPRALGNEGHGVVRGSRVAIIGRISMDLTVVDISGVDGVETGDAVTFLGRDGSETISLEEVASLAATINYEILTGFTPRIPRIWLDDGG